MIGLLIKHDPTLLTTKEDSGSSKPDIPAMNGKAESNVHEVTEEATLQRLLTLNCQWLLEDV